MITQPFEYLRADSAAAAAAALADADGSAAVLGGGTMLVPDMTHGRTRPSVVVDLVGAGLSYLERREGGTAVGAMTTYAALLSRGSPPAPRILAGLAAGVTGGPQIRNRGTVGGSASYANPASEVPAALLAHAAVLRLVSTSGVRDVPAAAYVVGAFATVRRPDELLTEVLVPDLGPGTRTGYCKLKLSEGSWPIATAAAVAVPGRTVRVALGGVAAQPLLLEVDPPPPGGPAASWRDHVAGCVAAVLHDPWSDVLADGVYRAEVAPVVAARAVLRACEEGRDD